MNVDTKLISKTFASRLKYVLPSLTSHQETAYVKNRNINESGRLISDILENCNNQKLNGYMVTMDIEKVFDSLDHNFLLTVLEKIGFGNNFISWIKVLLSNQESCVINGGSTTNYFKLERGARQGHPVSAYLFIIALEVLLIILRNNADIKGLKIFDYCFLYTAYADDSTFFVSDILSINEVISCFKNFSLFSGLKPNLDKCEVAGIGLLKGVKMAVCGMNCIDLTKETIKILGVHFSYNSQVQNEKNYLNAVLKIEKVLKLWRMRNLSLAGKITVSKSLAISKIVYLAMMTPVPKPIVNDLCKLHKEFLWGISKPKIKHETLCNNYENGGLKCINIGSKIISLQCSWIKKLYEENFHEWKVIPTYLIKTNLGVHFKFDSNLLVKKTALASFPTFYKNIFNFWSTYFSSISLVDSCILSQNLWYNSYIKINNTPVYIQEFSEKILTSYANFLTVMVI